jgi:hypothetical protein
MGTRDYRGFNRWLIGLVVVSVVLIGLCNFVIDPYAVWSAPRIQGLNKLKPIGDTENRLRVANEIQREKPTALIFGTSTSKQLPPDRLEDLVGGTATNAGMVMASMSEISTYLELAAREHPDLDQVVLALDFLQFNQRSGVPSKTVEPFDRPIIVTDQGLALLFSRAGIAASVTTVRANVVPPAASGAIGRGEAFDKYFTEIVAGGNTYQPYELSETALDDLEQIVEFCRARDIDLQILISPMHVAHAEVFREAGLDDEYAKWLRRVVSVTPVWDFSGYNSITTEPIEDTMTYYTDPLHYTTTTGSLMLERVFRHPEATSDFGTMVTDATVEQHLRATHALRERKQPQ